MYCSTMWYNCTVTAMRRLRIAYNQGRQTGGGGGWGGRNPPPEFWMGG